MYYLGLDVSTSCTGYCLLDCHGTIVKIGFVDLSKLKGLVTKTLFFKKQLEKQIVDIDKQDLKIVVEEAAQAFKKGMSSAQTIATLNQINGMMQLMASTYTNFEIQTVLPAICRSANKIKIIPEKKCGISTKEQVRKEFEKQTLFQFEKKELKSGPRKGTFEFDKRNYDSIDAWVASRWLWLTSN
jgi:hypothetical protein